MESLVLQTGRLGRGRETWEAGRTRLDSDPGLGALSARYHRAFNERDFDVWREIFHDDVELVIDGMPFRGVEAAVGYGTGSVAQFPNLYIADERVVGATGDTVVTEIQMVNGDPATGVARRQGTSCEICLMRDGRIASVRSYYMPEAPDAEEAVRVPARAEASRIAEEQVAQRRVATLVASGISETELFELVNREVGWLVGADTTALLRFDPEGTLTLVAAWSASGAEQPIGTSRPVDEQAAALRSSGRPMRWGTAVGVPIVVDGEVWGVSFTSSSGAPFPDDAEARIEGFMELVAAAISDAQARAELRSLVAEQAARERVATLVAQDVPQNELFDAVAAQVGRLLGADLAGLIRYVGDDTLEPVATWAADGEHADVGGEWPLEGNDLAITVRTTLRPARQDGWDDVPGPVAEALRTVLGVQSSVGSPILVDGEVWGGLFVHGTRRGEVLPQDTEARLESFCALVATAISNAQARTAARRLAEEQAALRRVATIVARESPSQEVLGVVAEEVGRVLHVEDIFIARFDSDDMVTVVAHGVKPSVSIPIGLRLPIGGDNVTTMVARTGRSARKDDYGRVSGSIGTRIRELGVRSAVAAPIAVGGRLWGVVTAASVTSARLPPDAEGHLAEFAELIATAIANLEARAALAASRARLVAASDDERRRVVRDLHDGAQQRLVHTVITLKRAQSELRSGSSGAAELVADALGHAQQATAELRELAQGIMPAVLTRGGMRAAIESLSDRAPVPVEIDVPADRLPGHLEATAYFVVAEALTNVAKHARATRAAVQVEIEGGLLRLEVRDDGIGGARRDGNGLLGLGDRLAVLDGRLAIESPVGVGTFIAAEIPIPEAAAAG